MSISKKDSNIGQYMSYFTWFLIFLCVFQFNFAKNKWYIYLIFLFLKISSWFVWDSVLRKYAIFNALTTARSDTKLNEVVLRLGQNVNLSNIQSIKLYYGGTEARQNYGKELYLPVTYISRDVSGKTLAANPSYSINKSQVNNPGRKVILNANQKLFPGINYFLDQSANETGRLFAG